MKIFRYLEYDSAPGTTDSQSEDTKSIQGFFLGVPRSAFVRHLEEDQVRAGLECFLTIPIPHLNKPGQCVVSGKLDPRELTSGLLNLFNSEHREFANSMVHEISLADVTNTLRWMESLGPTEAAQRCQFSSGEEAVRTWCTMVRYLVGVYGAEDTSLIDPSDLTLSFHARVRMLRNLNASSVKQLKQFSPAKSARNKYQLQKLFNRQSRYQFFSDTHQWLKDEQKRRLTKFFHESQRQGLIPSMNDVEQKADKTYVEQEVESLRQMVFKLEASLQDRQRQ